jgi:hypothetical protein
VTRNLITFDVRTAAPAPIEDVVMQVANALSCAFAEDLVDQVPSMVADVFGLTISIQPWRGVNDQPIFRLRSRVLDPRWVAGVGIEEPDFQSTDVSRYVADLLSLTTTFEWYLPTVEDRKAERDFGARLDEAY